MSGNWMTSERAQEHTRKAFLAVTGLVVALALWFGFSIWQAKSVRNEAQLMSEGQRKMIAQLRDTIARAEKLPKPTRSAGVEAVGAFQSSLVKQARMHGCLVTEFISSQTPAAFLTRYSNATTEGGWLQVEVKCQVQGPAHAIVRTLQSLRDVEIPFELQTLELVRQSTDRQGRANLSAQLSVNVLIQPPGATQ